MNQITDTILMIRPVNFRMNEQTAVNNYFQKKLDDQNADVNALAQEEFDTFVKKLRNAGVKVVVVDDLKENNTPDSIFPNNWVSFHQNGKVALYPMFAENRRPERREDILETLEEKGFVIEEIVDYTSAEKEGVFLEGTGSLLLDRENRKAYCALSSRADEELLIEFCEDFEYMPVIFHAYQDVDGARKPIYHTNVMMCLAEDFAVICLDCIDDKKERKNVVKHLKHDEKEIIAITEKQMHEFAGNMLQVEGAFGKKYLVMSDAAHKSLDKTQLENIEKYCGILSSDLETIETLGGGSARCMMAEVFLPERSV
ncbi:MAG TPA: arginine deiminase-related protein [Flavobacteriaceae bacterium]|nr:arginine deiminase-related protein [Flavobacteriaceae bacterium]